MIIIVVGMHRSGTSAMAGVLANNGIYMGEGYYHPKPMQENPKGFFEDRRFRQINDEILNINGYRVKSFETNIPDPDMMVVPDELHGHMQNLIHAQNEAHVRWGFKDPRTMLTLRFWTDIICTTPPIREVRVILMLRNNLDVALSMQRRGNPGSMHKLAQLANAYNRVVRQQHSQFIEVQFGELIYQTGETLKSVGERLGGVKLENNGFIEERLANRV